MSRAEIRRTYTKTRTDNYDYASTSSDIIPKQVTSSRSENSDSENTNKSTIIRDTHSAETGSINSQLSPKNNSQQTDRLGYKSLSEADKKVADFIENFINNKDSIQNKRDLLEKFIRKNASDAFIEKMTKIADEEAVKLKGGSIKKWTSIIASGMISQLTSFAVGSEAAIAAQRAWLFPVLSTICSELISDKAAALIRRTTYTTNDSKNLYRKQRLLAHAFGDMIRQCTGLEPEKKYRTNNPRYKGQKFTAWDAFWKDSDSMLKIFATNALNRGVPFLCFTGVYLIRDSLMVEVLKGAPGWQNFLLRLGAGATAGGLTALVNQLLTFGNIDSTEVPGHSTSYWHAKENYLSSIREDIRERLNEAGSLTDDAQKKTIETLLLDLDGKIQREIEVAKLKKSNLTAIPGEIKASIHRSRVEDSLDPDLPGSLSQSIHSLLGKFISLLLFTYLLDQSMRSKEGTNSFTSFPLLNLALLPFALIPFGYMWRDDLQLVSRAAHGGLKGAWDATVGREAYKEKVSSRSADNPIEVVTQIPDELAGQSENHTERPDNAKKILTGRELEAREKELARREKEAQTDSSQRKKSMRSGMISSSSEGMSDSGESDVESKNDSTSSSSEKVSGDSDGSDDESENYSTSSSSKKISGSSSSSASDTRSYATEDSDSSTFSDESPSPKRKRKS